MADVFIPVTQGKVTVVSPEDAELAQFNWHTNKNWHTHYARRKKVVEGKDSTLYLHREVMKRALGGEIPTGYSIDHIDGNGLNNRRSNLRLATASQNQQNRRMRNDNASGFTGVYFSNGYWQARITFKRNRISLGCYGTIVEAVIVRKLAEEILFGEFRYKGKL